MEVLINRIYKHFKGDYYIVLGIGKHSETLENCVIYRSLYGNGEIFLRPLESFISLVDKEKYPNATQKYKFELQEIESKRKN